MPYMSSPLTFTIQTDEPMAVHCAKSGISVILLNAACHAPNQIEVPSCDFNSLDQASGCNLRLNTRRCGCIMDKSSRPGRSLGVCRSIHTVPLSIACLSSDLRPGLASHLTPCQFSIGFILGALLFDVLALQWKQSKDSVISLWDVALRICPR
jgi:hypothetical protein